MPNKEQLIQQIKALKEEPDRGFVTRLEAKLVKRANQLEAKNRAIRYARVACSIIACLLLLGTFKMYAESEVPAMVAEVDSPVVLIYHTHSQESFISEAHTSTAIQAVSDPQRNISLVGKSLAGALQKNRVSAIQSPLDFEQEAFQQQKDESEPYLLSRNYVKEMLALHPTLQVVLDVHRDVRNRERTTTNKELATIRLVINNAHPSWEKNRDFALKISHKAKEMYPDFPIEVSQQKGRSPVYWNQDLHPHAILVEIGGIENTLDEEYASANVLAQLLTEVLRDDDSGT